jgi:glycerol-3-phosphate dehydrogenase
VINATGAFSDRLRLIAEPDEVPMIAPSQGIHLVFDGAFLAGESAIMVPHTRDGRVLFAIPWHGHTLVGTTDTAIPTVPLEPVAMNDEIDFILSTAGEYLAKAPTRADVLSVFAGVRPLVRAADAAGTAELSRDHVIQVGSSGLVSIMGGKWTTYRRMAEDCIDQAAVLAQLPERACATEHLHIHGFHKDPKQYGSLSVYGSDAIEIDKLIASDRQLGEQLHPALPYVKAEVVFAARQEMARTVEDVLARRTRALFLNARAAVEMAPVVADLMTKELAWSEVEKANQVKAFRDVAENYLLRN